MSGFVSSTPKVDIVAGGLWHACDLARGLADIGFAVRVVSSAPIPAGPYQRARVPVWTLQRLARRAGARQADVHRVLGRLLRERIRPDSQVIAWSSFASATLESGRNVVVVRGSHHILRQREILLELGSVKGMAVPSREAVALERDEYRRAVAVSVPTSEIATDQYWVEDGARIAVNPYGFPIATGHNDDGGISRSVIFVGAAGLQKGIDRLAAALPTRTSLVSTVQIVGKVSPEIERRDLPTWWTLRGQVSGRTARHLIGASSILILLSRQEGMARVGMEAMAEGTPIVVSPASGLSSWLGDGGGMVVDPDDPDSIRGAIESVLRRWDSHSLRAREVAASWTWEQHAEEMARCLPR